MTEWEIVRKSNGHDGVDETVERLPVPGGWIYKVSEYLDGKWTQNVVFVADTEKK